MNDTASAEAKEAGSGYASTGLEQAAMCEFMCFLPRGKTMHRAQLFLQLQDLKAKTMFSNRAKCPERQKKESLANPVSIDLRGQ